MMLTFLQMALGDSDGAAACGRRALRRMPAITSIRNNVTYALARRRELRSAQCTLGDAATLDPTCMPAAGYIQVRAEDVDEGLAIYEQAAEASPNPRQADLMRHRAALEAERLGRPTPHSTHSFEARYPDDPASELASREVNNPFE